MSPARYPPNEDALDPGFHWAPQFSRPATTPARERFPVRVDWPDDPGLVHSPVTFGVPFADGALDTVEHARLVTADGTVAPARSSSVALTSGGRRTMVKGL